MNSIARVLIAVLVCTVAATGPTAHADAHQTTYLTFSPSSNTSCGYGSHLTVVETTCDASATADQDGAASTSAHVSSPEDGDEVATRADQAYGAAWFSIHHPTNPSSQAVTAVLDVDVVEAFADVQQPDFTDDIPVLRTGENRAESRVEMSLYELDPVTLQQRGGRGTYVNPIDGDRVLEVTLPLTVQGAPVAIIVSLWSRASFGLTCIQINSCEALLFQTVWIPEALDSCELPGPCPGPIGPYPIPGRDMTADGVIIAPAQGRATASASIDLVSLTVTEA